jgi:hypothetical protein
VNLTMRVVSDIERLGERELQLLAEREDKLTGLSEVELRAGGEYLDGKTNLDPAIRLRGELEVIDRAIAACRDRRCAALTKRLQARVESLRNQAAQKRAELKALTSKTDRLLASLAELEGVPYTRIILNLQPVGEISLQLHVPRSAVLEQEVTELERQASGLEARGVPQHGIVDLSDATSTQALLDALVKHEGKIPNLGNVFAWASACEAKAFPRKFGDSKRRFRLVWDTNGKIEPGSYIFVSELARTSGTESFDVPRGTFKAA